MRRHGPLYYNDNGLAESVSVTLMVILVIAVAAIIASIVFGLVIFYPKSAYIAVQAEAKNVSSDNWYISVYDMGGDIAHLNRSTAKEGMPVDFQVAPPNGGVLYPAADGPITWKPGDTLFIYNTSGLLVVTQNEARARAGSGLPKGVWRFDVVDVTDNVLIYTTDLRVGIAAPVTGYTWQNFFTGPNVSSPYPYSPVFHGATPLPWVQGHNPGGVGLFFNGTTYVSIPNSPELAPPSGIRVDTWVQWAIPPGTGDHWANIVTKGDNGGNMQYALQHNQNNNLFEFAVLTTSGRAYVQSSGGLTLQQGTWYHVVGSYSAATGKIEISVNGATPAVTNHGGNLASGNYNLHIGEGLDTNNLRYFNGIISDVNVTAM